MRKFDDPIKPFLEVHTVIYCDIHGWVIGKWWGESMERASTRYYIKYCCGVRNTSEKPETLLALVSKEGKT